MVTSIGIWREDKWYLSYSLKNKASLEVLINYLNCSSSTDEFIIGLVKDIQLIHFPGRTTVSETDLPSPKVIVEEDQLSGISVLHMQSLHTDYCLQGLLYKRTGMVQQKQNMLDNSEIRKML